jgi:hypothetical protein
MSSYTESILSFLPTELLHTVNTESQFRVPYLESTRWFYRVNTKSLSTEFLPTESILIYRPSQYCVAQYRVPTNQVYRVYLPRRCRVASESIPNRSVESNRVEIVQYRADSPLSFYRVDTELLPTESIPSRLPADFDTVSAYGVIPSFYSPSQYLPNRHRVW